SRAGRSSVRAKDADESTITRTPWTDISAFPWPQPATRTKAKMKLDDLPRTTSTPRSPTAYTTKKHVGQCARRSGHRSGRRIERKPFGNHATWLYGGRG